MKLLHYANLSTHGKKNYKNHLLYQKNIKLASYVQEELSSNRTHLVPTKGLLS